MVGIGSSMPILSHTRAKTINKFVITKLVAVLVIAAGGFLAGAYYQAGQKAHGAANLAARRAVLVVRANEHVDGEF